MGKKRTGGVLTESIRSGLGGLALDPDDDRFLPRLRCGGGGVSGALSRRRHRRRGRATVFGRRKRPARESWVLTLRRTLRFARRHPETERLRIGRAAQRSARRTASMATPLATSSFPYPFPSPPLSKTLANPSSKCKPPLLSASLAILPSPVPFPRRRRDVSAAYGDDDMDDDFGDLGVDDGDGVGDDDDLDNEQDYDVDYDRLLAPVKPPPRPLSREGDEEEGDFAMVAPESFVSTQESASDTVVDYAVDEGEFHKIRLLHCDFLIRKVPDPDDDVFDFREMYVTPPDTDIYSIPRVLAPMPQKYIRCTKKNFGRYHVSEPPVEHLRDPLYKTEREIMKVFLTKHYRNRRFNDPDFFLDFEEIYVIDSKTRSITRAKVVVSVPEGKKRDRRNDLLLIRDGGDSFRIIDKTKRDDATTVIQREEWAKSRQDVEKHFRKLRDFDYSNWF